MTSEMIIAALRSGADHLDSKPSVTNTFYGSLMRDSADRISDVEQMYRTQTARIAKLERENATLREKMKVSWDEISALVKENAALREELAAIKRQAPSKGMVAYYTADQLRLMVKTHGLDEAFVETVLNDSKREAQP